MQFSMARVAAISLCICVLGGGCRMMKTHSEDGPDVGASAVQTAPSPTRIVYRTRTDRLNISGGRLPPCSIATLVIVAPHPDGKFDAAQATLLTTPCTEDASPFPEHGLTDKIVDAITGDDGIAQGPAEFISSADVPLWQVNAVVRTLEKANFFDRKRTILSPDVFVSAETKRYAVGKRYRPVDELDGLLVRVAESAHAPSLSRGGAGRPNPPRGYSHTRNVELARLPAVNAH